MKIKSLFRQRKQTTSVRRRNFIKSTLAVAAALGLQPVHGIMGILGGAAVAATLQNPIGAVVAGGGTTNFVYEGNPIFKNRVRESVVTVHASSTYANVGSDGWLDGSQSDVDIIFFECSSGYTLPSWMSGTWTCGLIGTGSEGIVGINGATVSGVTPGTGGAYTTFTMTVAAGSTSPGVHISNITAPVRKIFLNLPEYPATQVDDWTQASAFTNEAIAHYKQFAVLQTEWFNNSTNNNLLSTSSNRNSASNTQFRKQWNGFSVSLNSSALPGNGATSGTFAANWPFPSGLYGIPMKSASTLAARVCTCANGSTAFNWDPTYPLTEAVSQAGLQNPGGLDGLPIEVTLALAQACGVPVWIHLPLIEDGTYWSAGSYATAVFNLIGSMGITVPVYVTTSLEIWNYWENMYQGLRIQSASGYANDYDYWAYRFHALANLGRSILGSKWGTQVRQIFEWQTKSPFFWQVCNSIATQFGGNAQVAQDLYALAAAPYTTPVVGASDSVATIEGYIQNGQGTNTSGGPIQALKSMIENIASVALYFGLKMFTYETGPQWNAVNANGNTNISAAILDTGGGYQSAINAYYTSPQGGVLNAGVTLACHNTSGVNTAPASADPKTPEDEFTNNYSNLATSPTLLALQALMPGFQPTRNAITARGQSTDCINYVDNNSSLVSTYQAYGTPGGFNWLWNYPNYGYSVQLVWFWLGGTYTPVVTYQNTAAGTADFIVNGTTYASGQTVPSGNGTVTFPSVTMNAGWNMIAHGKLNSAQSGVVPKSIQWN